MPLSIRATPNGVTVLFCVIEYGRVRFDTTPYPQIRTAKRVLSIVRAPTRSDHGRDDLVDLAHSKTYAVVGEAVRKK